jgi:hypothetical protein
MILWVKASTGALPGGLGSVRQGAASRVERSSAWRRSVDCVKAVTRSWRASATRSWWASSLASSHCWAASATGSKHFGEVHQRLGQMRFTRPPGVWDQTHHLRGPGQPGQGGSVAVASWSRMVGACWTLSVSAGSW